MASYKLVVILSAQTLPVVLVAQLFQGVIQGIPHHNEHVHSAGTRPSPLNQDNIAGRSATDSTPQLKQINDSIYVLCNPPNPAIEVVFFHAINWRESKQPHVETWSDDTTGVFWPRDALSVQYPEARILLAWYDAGAGEIADGGHKRLFEVAVNLRQDILPVLTGDCRLLLVGHGFGALVIKELVRLVQIQRNLLGLQVGESKVTDDLLKYCDTFLENVRGAFFFAPPSFGSSLVKATEFNVKGSLVKSLDSMDEHTAELNEWDEYTARLNEWFRKWRGVKGCKVTVIWAGLPTTIEFPTKVVCIPSNLFQATNSSIST
ncbi:unnamed protein product [Calypogeia fissa]